MKHLKKDIMFPRYPSITAYNDNGEEEVDVFIGDIAEQYLRKFASVSGTDKTFGLRDKDGKFYIVNRKAKIKEYNIVVVIRGIRWHVWTMGAYSGNNSR